MEIILLQNIDKVGGKYELATVKNGYARNFLIPKGMALIANSTNMRRLEDYRRRQAAKEAKMVGQYETIAAKLKEKTLRIGAKAGTSGKIFGSVTNIQLSNAIQDQFGIEIDRKKIELPDDVKTLGTYTAIVHLHDSIDSTVVFDVVAE